MFASLGTSEAAPSFPEGPGTQWGLTRNLGQVTTPQECKDRSRLGVFASKKQKRSVPRGGGGLGNLTKRRLGRDLRPRAAAGLGGCPEGSPCRLQLDRPLTRHTAWHPRLSFHRVAVWVAPHMKEETHIGCKMMTLQNDLSPFAGLC